jgi:Cd2+/Zn2+-exporting ATPase
MPSSAPDLQFRIHGMDCAEEIAILKREVAPRVGGVDRLVFNLLEGTMTIQSPSRAVSARAVEEAVARAGMRAELLRDQAGPPAALRPEAALTCPGAFPGAIDPEMPLVPARC